MLVRTFSSSTAVVAFVALSACSSDPTVASPPADDAGKTATTDAATKPVTSADSGTHTDAATDGPPPMGPQPKSCTQASDCTNACPPEAKGCTCATTPDGKLCVPTCTQDSDCPQLDLVLSCSTDKICTPKM